MIDRLIRAAWMRDFSYEDYCNICDSYGIIPVSREAYYGECGKLEYDMEEYYRIQENV